MTKRQDTVKGIIQLLGDSGLSVDEQIKALGEVRAKVTRPFHVAMPFTGTIDKPGKNKKKEASDE